MKRLVLFLFLLVSPVSYASDDFQNVFVFGDSLSDAGNLASLAGPFPNPPFFNNRVSNGPTAVDVAAAGLGLSTGASLHLIGAAVGTNYAVAGARAAGEQPIDLPTQVTLFLANQGGVASADSLYLMLIGGNDIRDARDVPDPAIAEGIIVGAVTSQLQQLQVLVASGAEKIVVLNVPDIGGIPENAVLSALFGDDTISRRATRLTKAYNKALKRGVRRLVKASRADIAVFNTFGVFREIIEDAEENGFTNTTDACFSSISFTFNPGCAFGANFPQYIFFDEIHPTARVHEMIGQSLLERISDQEDDDDEDEDDEDNDDDGNRNRGTITVL